MTMWFIAWNDMKWNYHSVSFYIQIKVHNFYLTAGKQSLSLCHFTEIVCFLIYWNVCNFKDLMNSQLFWAYLIDLAIAESDDIRFILLMTLQKNILWCHQGTTKNHKKPGIFFSSSFKYVWKIGFLSLEFAWYFSANNFLAISRYI